MKSDPRRHRRHRRMGNLLRSIQSTHDCKRTATSYPRYHQAIQKHSKDIPEEHSQNRALQTLFFQLLLAMLGTQDWEKSDSWKVVRQVLSGVTSTMVSDLGRQSPSMDRWITQVPLLSAKTKASILLYSYSMMHPDVHGR